MEAFTGTSAEFDVLLGDTVLARIHFMVRTTPGPDAGVRPQASSRRELAAAARRWDDELRDALIEAEGEARGIELFKRCGAAFPPDYRERVPARERGARRAQDRGAVGRGAARAALYRPLGGAAERARLQALPPAASRSCCRTACRCSSTWACACSASSRYRIEHAARRADLAARLRAAGAGRRRARHRGAGARCSRTRFARVFRGEVENDDFNRLVLRAGLAADEIVVLRAYAKYLQADRLRAVAGVRSRRRSPRIRASRACWSRCSGCASIPAGATTRRAQRRRCTRSSRRSTKVSNLSEDRVLRQLLALIQATLRTNFWRTRRRPSARRAAPQLPQLQVRPGAGARAARARSRCSRSSSTRRASRASTCAAARSRAAACAGRTGRRTSAPRCSAW